MERESFISAAQNMFETGSLQKEACQVLRGETRKWVGRALKVGAIGAAKLALGAF